MLTLTEAAELVGLTRAGLHKAIKAGRMSATKGHDGQWLVDPAELFRVYQPVDAVSSTKIVNQSSTVDGELIVQKLEFTERLLRQVEAERDHLRQSLTQALGLLTHQPEDTQSEPSAMNDRLLKKLFRGKE